MRVLLVEDHGGDALFFRTQQKAETDIEIELSDVGKQVSASTISGSIDVEARTLERVRLSVIQSAFAVDALTLPQRLGVVEEEAIRVVGAGVMAENSAREAELCGVELSIDQQGLVTLLRLSMLIPDPR